MSELVKMRGRLLTFDKVDKCGILFSKDCKITYSGTLPVLRDFDRSSLDKVVGIATVSRDDSGLICDAVLYKKDVINLLPEFNGELPIGGFYSKLKDQRVGNVRIIEECYLASVSVVLDPASDDYKMSLVKESEDQLMAMCNVEPVINEKENEEMKHEELIEKIDEQIMKNRCDRQWGSLITARDELKDNNHLLGRIKTVLRSAGNEYERGCNDAWELARKFFGSTGKGAYPSSEFYKIFDDYGMAQMMDNHTYQEAYEKVQAYEQKKKEEAEKPVVGDVVEVLHIGGCDLSGNGHAKGILIAESNDNCYYLLTNSDRKVIGFPKEYTCIKKTGKRVDIQGMLDELKED